MSTAFVSEILNNPHLTREVTNVKKRAIFLVIQGVCTVLIGIILTLQVDIKRKEVYSNEKITDKIRKNVFYSKINMIISGGVLLFNAINLIYFYQPSNTEISLAILIRYLKEEGLLKNDMYKVLKEFKPYRIETLKLKS